MVYLGSMQRNVELEATIVAKYAAVSPVLDERSRRRWAAAESVAIGYGGDALVSVGHVADDRPGGARGIDSGDCRRAEPGDPKTVHRCLRLNRAPRAARQ